MIEKKIFGTLPDNREVYQYTLTNKSGCTVTIINFGAIVTSLLMPDRNGVLENLVLNYDSLHGYVNDQCYFGAIAGRYGNRIAKGRFQLEGNQYQLSINDGTNHLHGGKTGFSKKLWEGKILNTDSEPSLALTLISPDQEEGYPGTVTLTVTYTLTEKNELRIDYKGTTDRTTILNPTHHSYFNLSGSCANTILDHELSIDSDFITMVDHELISTGESYHVHHTPLDFRTPKAVGRQINERDPQMLMGKGYDHNWILKNFDGHVRNVAQVYEPRSGRHMAVLTDQPGLQFYSGNFLGGTVRGKDGFTYQNRSGLCLEAQCPPDSPNKPEFPSVVLKENETYHQTTIYHFSIK
ncbi:MAG: galactose mutarotase [Ignavibacteriae bacterium]|nr:MAG: galactose mutarotase [Ignavibacteriota bacterium]